jgi:hypothetical protein
MSQAENFVILLNAARGLTEWTRELSRAANVATSETHDTQSRIVGLEFGDGSAIDVDPDQHSAALSVRVGDTIVYECDGEEWTAEVLSITDGDIEVRTVGSNGDYSAPHILIAADILRIAAKA